MRFESAKSTGMRLGIAALCAIIVALAVLYCIFFDGFFKYIVALMCIAVAALLIWVRVDTYYVLREKSLLLKSGPFRDVIPYDEIKTADKTRGWNFIMALDFNRLQINAGLNPEKGKIVLSPENEDEFLAELAKHCPELKIRE